MREREPQGEPKLREQVYRLLVDGYGPGGGYYEPHQRLDAAVSLLQCGWGTAEPRAAPTDPSELESLRAWRREAEGLLREAQIALSTVGCHPEAEAVAQSALAALNAFLEGTAK